MRNSFAPLTAAPPPQSLHPNFNLIARAKGLLQTHFVPSVVAMSGVDGKPARRLADIRPVLDFVDSA